VQLTCADSINCDLILVEDVDAVDNATVRRSTSFRDSTTHGKLPTSTPGRNQGDDTCAKIIHRAYGYLFCLPFPSCFASQWMIIELSNLSYHLISYHITRHDMIYHIA